MKIWINNYSKGKTMKYKFYNKESKKEVTFETDSLYTFIYGPNGSGKTTFSREYYDKKDDNIIYKVFNEDFINNNVYVTDMDGSKQSAENKKGLNKLFIGKNVKKYSDFLTRIRERKNQINSTIVNNGLKNISEYFVGETDKIFKDNEEYIKNRNPFINHILEEEYINNSIDEIKTKINIEEIKISVKNILKDKFTKNYEYKFDFDINYDLIKEEILEYLKSKNKRQTEEYNKSINGFEINIKNQLNSLFEELPNQIERIRRELEIEAKKYEIIQKIDEKNKKYLKTSIERTNLNIDEIEQWQKEGYRFHKEIDFEECLYCHNKEIEKDVKENYKTIYENKYIKLLEELKNKIDKFITPIINNKAKFEMINNFYEKTERNLEFKIIQDLYKYIEKISEIINGIYKKRRFDKILIDEFEEFSEYYRSIKQVFDKIENDKEEDKKDEKKLKETFKLLYSNTEIKRDIKKEIFLNNLMKIENDLKERINQIQIEEIQKVEEHLKFYQEIFNTKYNIENVKSTVSSAQEANAMLEIRFNNRRKIKEISTGEKNILALIIFFSNVEYELKKLNENQKITIILDDPVNSNDWNIFFSLQTIVEDYFQKFYRNKLEDIIILSHNVDYAVIQLQNLRENNKIKFLRLFPDICINIDIELIYTNDIKLISNFIYEWIKSFTKDKNIYYIDLNKSYRVFLSYRKFFEDIIYERSHISQIQIDEEHKQDIEKLKDISNDSDIIELLDYSSQILYNVEDSKVNVNQFTKKFINVILKIINSENILDIEKSDLSKALEELNIEENTIFKIKGKEEIDTIRANDFQVDGENINQEKMKDILVKAFTIKKDKRNKDEVKFMQNQSKTYYINYMKHCNELVGKPLLALDVEPMIKFLNEQ